MVEINEHSSLGREHILQGKNNKTLHKSLVPNKWITYFGSTNRLEKYLFIKKKKTHRGFYYREQALIGEGGCRKAGLGWPSSVTCLMFGGFLSRFVLASYFQHRSIGTLKDSCRKEGKSITRSVLGFKSRSQD